MKDNDMVALMLFNPEATMLDLDASGINILNTGIKDESEYLKLDQVRENNKFKDLNGNFSEQKFHEFYIDAMLNYNILAQGGWQPTFHENNIFVKPLQRRQGPEFQEVTIENPFQRTMSFKDLGEWGPQTKSIREIAESLQVYNTETGEWMDSPETSFFGTIGMGPLVLATWDFDADANGSPTTDPKKVVHKKGEYKLNNRGTFYYETLGNRSSHGKDLLHYSDIITNEGSTWNKIDFLDSDDLEKSVMGTVAKNVALVGSLFIPGGVGYAITGLTILLQSLKLGATLGRMLLGSENSFMNNLEAFASATDLHESTSDHAREQMWSWENLIQTAGDAISLLRQQRILFEAVPWAMGYGGLGKGKGIFTSEGQAALQKRLIEKYNNSPLNFRNIEQNGNLMDIVVKSQELQHMNQMKAMIEANNLTKHLTEMSGAISKAYMTGITVNDMFLEAKDAGMSDIGAIAMTLGYAAAEYRLLSTGIGEMILPELRALRIQTKQLLQNLGRDTKEALENKIKRATTPELKRNAFWSAFNTGKRLWEDNRSGLAKGITNMVVAGVGEGVEEVSEEVLADAVRAMHDLGNWSSGKMFTTENALDRYAMNFIGGMIGGGVNGLTTDFSVFNRMAGLSAQDSLKQLIYKINNGEKDEILKTIEKTLWGDKNLSATKAVYDDKTKTMVWQEATSESDSQNEAIKTQLRNQIYSVINVLEANGASLSEKSLFDYNTLREARFSMLANTSTAARYSEEFADRCAKLVENYNKGVELDKGLSDEQKRDKESEEYKTYLRKKEDLERERKELVKGIEEIKQGKQAARFIGTALLEMHPAVSLSLMLGPTLDLFAQRTKGKSFRDLSDEEKQECLKSYKNYKATQAKDDAIAAYDTWERIMDAVLKTFAPEVEAYNKELDEYSKLLDTIVSLMDSTDKAQFLREASVLTGFFDVNEANMLAQHLPNGEEFIKLLLKILDEFDNKLNVIEELYKTNRLKISEGKFSEVVKGTDSQLQTINTIVKTLLLFDDKIVEQARNSIINEVYLDPMNRGLDLDLIEEQINFRLTYELENRVKELTELNKEARETLVENFKKKLLDENFGDKSLLILKDTLNGLLIHKSIGYQLYYLTNNFNEILDSIKKTGYLNPVTKAKLERMLTQVNRWIDVYGKYMTDREYVIGAEDLVDKDIPTNNIPIGNEDSGHDYETTPNQANILSNIDFLVNDLNLQGYLSDYLYGKKNGKLIELKKKIEGALLTPDSPARKLLDAFALDLTGQQFNFSSLMEVIENEIKGKSQTIEELIQRVEAGLIDLDDVVGNIDLAIKLIDLLYSVLMGARSDSAGFEQNQLLSTGIPNFGFHFGINSIINEVKKKMGDKSKPFLTIEGKLTDNIVVDLHLISKLLLFYRDLYGINSGLKLKNLPKITLRATQLIYKALRRLCDVAPEDLDKSMLTEFFKEGSIIGQNLDKKLVDNDTLEQMQKERIELENALYDFAHKKENIGKKLLNIKELASIFKDESIILNESTEELSISSMLGYLASRMSIRASNFYNEYRQQISEDLAPLTLQELEAYGQIANALNGDEYTGYKNQFRKELLEYLEGLSEDERIKLFVSQGMDLETATFYGLDMMKPYLKLLPFIPYYDNISFVEGIAGSGKTHGVLNMVTRLLAKSAPNLLEKALIAHITTKDAENLGNNLGLKNAVSKSRKELLLFISTWKEPSKVNDKYEYKEGEDYIVLNGQIKQAYKLKTVSEVPSIIIIDEIGQYTDLELMTIDAFAKEHGISVLAFGDLDQNINSGSVKIKIPGIKDAMLKKLGLSFNLSILKDKNNDVVSFDTNMQRGQMMHGFKLGFSMRTRSIQQDKNQAMILAKIKNPQGDVVLHYYEGNDPNSGEFVLNGAKVLKYTNNTDLLEREKEAIELVEKLIPTLKKDEKGNSEKIGLIYLSKDSRILKSLKDKYGDLIEEYPKKDAQGKEAKYFIMETDWTDKDSGSIMRELNTGVTRAKNGIIVLSKDPMDSSGIMRIESEQDASTKTMELKPAEIEQFSKVQKEAFDRICKNFLDGKLEYKQRSKAAELRVNLDPPSFNVTNIEKQGNKYIITVEPVKINNDWLKEKRENAVTINQFICDLDGYNVLVLFEEDNKIVDVTGKITDYLNVTLEEEVIIPPQNLQEIRESNGDDSVEETLVLSQDPVDETPTFDYDEHKRTIENRTDGRPVLSLYTVSGAETGGFIQETDEHGELVPNGKAIPIDGKKHNNDRIDSMNGLIKIFGNNMSYEEMLGHLLFIQNAIHTLNREKLEEEIKKHFVAAGIAIDKLTLQFGMWTSSNKKMSRTLGALERGENERSLFNEIEEANISRHTFSLLIKFKKNGEETKSLLIPIGFLTSPFTLAQSYPANSPIGVKMAALTSGLYGSFNEFVEDVLTDATIYQAHPELYNLFKLYHFDYAGFFPVVKENGKIRFGWNRNGNDTFSLKDSSFGDRGILIMTGRGYRQINGEYQLETKLSKEFVGVKEWMKDKRLKTSSRPYVFTLKGSNRNATIKRKNRETGLLYDQYVIKGRPFILVSNKTFTTDENMMKAYIDGDPSVKLVYLTPPLLSFELLMKDLIDYENNNIDHFTANDATAFNILNILRHSDETKDIFKNKLKNVGVTNIRKVISLLDRLEAAYNNATEEEIIDGNRRYKRKNYSEFVKILKESDDFFGSGINLFKLRKVLRLVTSTKLYGIDDINDDENSRGHFIFELDLETLKKFKKALENAEYLIYDSVKINKNARDLIPGVAVAIDTDTSDNFTINGGRELLMDARVTTPTFFSEELHPFINKLVNEYIVTIIRNLDGSTTMKNTQTKNQSIQPSLIKEFFRELDDSTPDNTYTPSENYNTLSAELNSISTELQSYGINIPAAPTNLVEENEYIRRAIEIINTTPTILKIAIKRPDSTIKVIDYSEVDCLKAFITGPKKLTQSDDKNFEFEIGGKQFTATINTESGETKINFTDMTPEPEQQNQGLQGTLTLNFDWNTIDRDNPKDIDILTFPIYFKLELNITMEITIEDYVNEIFNYLSDQTVDAESKQYFISTLTTGTSEEIRLIRDYLLNNFKGLRKDDGTYDQQLFEDTLEVIGTNGVTELERLENPNQDREEENKCNKFSISI